MSFKRIKEIEKEIEMVQLTVDREYMPLYHAAPPVGWINDPNGFVYFNGCYHLYGQFYPYSSQWGLMHWGHWTSTDLVHWRWCGVALAPDTPADEGGCFSGSSWVVEDTLYIAYTGLCSDGKGGYNQLQCIASSKDGYTFEKMAGNPVIGKAELPEGASPYDFRDPKLMRDANGFRVIAAAQVNGKGKLLSFTSQDLEKWHYEGVFWEGMPQMLECPDIFELAGKTSVLTSIIGMPKDGRRYPHDQPSLFFRVEDGKMPIQMIPETLTVLDHGQDFYAAQTTLAPDGRRLLIGWFQCWAHKYMPTDELGHGWNGCMSLVRELEWKEGKLIQRPVAEIERLRDDPREINQTIGEKSFEWLNASDASEIQLELTNITAASVTLELMKTGEECLLIRYEPEAELLTVDTSKCGHKIRCEKDRVLPQMTQTDVKEVDGRLMLRMFVDRCSLEIFVGEGEAVISTRIFPKKHGRGICLSAVGGEADARLVVYNLMI